MRANTRAADQKLNDSILSNQANNVPLSEARDRVIRSFMLLDSDRPDEMRTELETARELLLETGPQIWLQRFISALYARAGNIDEAQTVLNEIEEIANPDADFDRSVLLYLEGELELAEGNYTEAIQKFTQSFSINENSYAEWSLAFTHYLAGNYEESVQIFDTYLGASQFGTEKSD